MTANSYALQMPRAPRRRRFTAAWWRKLLCCTRQGEASWADLRLTLSTKTFISPIWPDPTSTIDVTLLHWIVHISRKWKKTIKMEKNTCFGGYLVVVKGWGESASIQAVRVHRNTWPLVMCCPEVLWDGIVQKVHAFFSILHWRSLYTALKDCWSCKSMRQLLFWVEHPPDKRLWLRKMCSWGKIDFVQL